MEKQHIFVSGVQTELEEERFAVNAFVTQNALLKKHFDAFIFEDLPAGNKSAESIYLKKVAESDILILLLGKEYGSTRANGLSATEKEFREAAERGLKILVFVKEARDSERDARVKNLIMEIGKPDCGCVYRKFNEVPDLKEQVFNSLVALMEEESFILNAPFDLRICERVVYGDINEDLVRDFLDNRATKFGAGVPKTPVRELLLKILRVTKEKDGALLPTNAAILFFCDVPQKFIPQSSVKIARHRGATRMEFVDSQELKGPLYQILADVEKFFKRNTRLAGKIVDFKRVEIPEYPFEAIREAVVNAMAHRDYLRSGSNVQVDIFDDRVEVTSPGKLLPGLDIKNLEGLHETRNKKICEIFHETRDMERYGTGITKMSDLMKNCGLKPPTLSQPGDFFRATFYGPGDKILDAVSSVPEERQTDLKELGLSERQIGALALMLNESKVLTNSLYQKIFKVSRRTALRDLQGLVEARQVIMAGVGKGAKYTAQ